MSSAIRPAPQFQVGDWVSFLYGASRVQAQVVEDRGPLGLRGRRLYRVRLDREQGESSTFELPEEILAAGESPRDANPLLTATLDYLGQGKRFARIRPRGVAKSNRNVEFHFSDGSMEERSFDCDEATFLKWWKSTSEYLRGMADAFDRPS